MPSTSATRQSVQSITTVSGNDQSAEVNTDFAPFQVQVTNLLTGDPVAGLTVTFQAPDTGATGTFADTGTTTETVVTDASGLAASSVFTANGQPGAYNVTVSASESDSQNFRVTNDQAANPSVTGVVADPAIVGTDGTLKVTVSFSEAMSRFRRPALSFSPDISNVIDPSTTGVWTDNQTYEVTYTITDDNAAAAGVDVIVPTTFISVRPARSPLAAPFTEADAFGIDQGPPVVTSLVPDPLTVGPSGTFKVTVDFSQNMDRSVEPDLEFDPDVTANVLTTVASKIWADDDTYEVTYNIANPGVSIDDVDITAPATFQNVAGDASVAYTETDAFDIEQVGPVVQEVSADPTLVGTSGTLTVTVRFSQQMDETITPALGFDPDVSGVLNTTATGSWTDAFNYEVAYTITNDSAQFSGVNVMVPSTFESLAGGLPSHAQTEVDVFDIDQTGPIVTHVTASPAEVGTGGVFEVTVDFSEDMDTSIEPTLSFLPANVSLVLDDTTTGSWEDDDTYKVTYTVTDADENISNADIVVPVSFESAANVAMQQPYTEVDAFSIVQTAPMVISVSADPQTVGTSGDLTVIVGFSETMDTTIEPALSFTPDVSAVLNSGATGIWTDDDTYTIVYTVTNAGVNIADVNVIVPESVFKSDSGADIPTYTQTDAFSIAQSRPQAFILAPSEDIGLTSVVVEVFFSEPVCGFDTSGLMVVNATAELISPTGACTGDAANYHFVYAFALHPEGAGNITIDVPANVAEDIVGNLNTAAQQQIIRAADTATRARAVIRNFIADRADQIIANDPGLAGRLTKRTGSGRYITTNGRQLISTSLGVAGLRGEGITEESRTAEIETGLHQVIMAAHNEQRISAAADVVFGQKIQSAPVLPRYDLWLKARYQRINADGRKGDLGLLHLGADYLVNSGLLIGIIAQADIFDQKDTNLGASADGFGWMVGPYVVTQLMDGLVFDARAAWGQSYNHVSPFNTYTDDFDTDRWLVKAALTGNFSYQGWTLNPAVSVHYFEEKQKAYTDTPGFRVESQTVELGRLKFGPSVSRTFEVADGVVITPRLALEGLWDFATANRQSATGQTLNADALRARVEGGLTMYGPGGALLTVTGNYDGIGSNDLEAYGGSAEVSVPF